MQVIKEYSGIKVTINEEDLNKNGVIYLLEFPNGKVYIGQTTQKLRNRLCVHCISKGSKCVKVKRAVQKYKEFKVSVLEENLTIGQLNSFEGYYIKLFNSNAEDGYNLDSGGNNRIMSEETKKKISDGNKGKVISEETRKKLSDVNIGKVCSEETKKKMSESRKGSVMSELTKASLLLSNYKQVKSIPDNIVFNSVKEASIYYNINRTALHIYYNGKIHKKTGQTFVFVLP